MGLSANVRAGLDIMVAEGLKRSDAAARVGISDSALYQALRKTEVLGYYNEQLALLRGSEAARNTHALLTIRDRAMEPRASAAFARAGVEAVKTLEAAREGRPNLTVNVNVTPGYAIEFGRPRVIEHVSDEVISVADHRADDLFEADA